MSESDGHISKEVLDALFQQDVRRYMRQDEADKAEIKKDLKTVQILASQHVTDIAVIKTEAKESAKYTGIISGAIVSIIVVLIGGLVEYFLGLIHKN